jgi:hypothetical protein
MPTGGRIFAFFCSPRDHRPQNSGCVYTAQSFHTGWTRRRLQRARPHGRVQDIRRAAPPRSCHPPESRSRMSDTQIRVPFMQGLPPQTSGPMVMRSERSCGDIHRYNWHRTHGGIGSTLPISRLGLTGNNLLRIHSYSARVIPEAASFRRTACAHSSSILKYRATAFVPTSKGCASPGWRSFSILSLVAAPLNWD